MKAAVFKRVALLLCLLSTASCTTLTQNLVAAPDVQLQQVDVVGLGFKSQTFLLTFNVSNPNPFALPIDSVAYGVKLDGQRFASGETSSEFSVPASGNTNFAISVDLNLLQTAPQLLAIIRNGIADPIPYELEGAFGVAMPMAPILRYAHSGDIHLDLGSY